MEPRNVRNFDRDKDLEERGGKTYKIVVDR